MTKEEEKQSYALVITKMLASCHQSIVLAGLNITIEYDYDPGEPCNPAYCIQGEPEEYTIQKAYLEVAEWLVLDLSVAGLKEILIKELKLAEAENAAEWIGEQIDNAA